VFAGEYELVGLESNFARPIKEAFQAKLNENVRENAKKQIQVDDARVASMLQSDGFKNVNAPPPNAPIPNDLELMHPDKAANQGPPS